MSSLMKNEGLEWLLMPDEDYPSVRFLTLKNICQEGGKALEEAQEKIYQTGLIPKILKHQSDGGYWENPDSIYYPKYTGTVWQLILLAQLGASKAHPAIEKACEFLFASALTDFGGFSLNGKQTGCAYCIQGNICAALLDMGFFDDTRLERALDWMARGVTGEGFLRIKKGETNDYYTRSGISGPGFLCSANDHQPCAWGAVKVGLALGKVPSSNRSSSIDKAIQTCKDFLLSTNPAKAAYPHPYAKNPSRSWFQFGFPVFYVTDLIQNLEVLASLGVAGDPRLIGALDIIRGGMGEGGTWKMTYSYQGKMWQDIEEKGKASKFVTYRARCVLMDYKKQ